MGKCKVCGKVCPDSKMWYFCSPQAGYDWRNPDTTNYPSGLFCSTQCARSIHPSLHIKQIGLIGGCLFAIIKAPFRLCWWLIKQSWKACWWGIKKFGRFCWIVGMNKWTWTIFSVGFSWLFYKLLVYVYEKKH